MNTFPITSDKHHLRSPNANVFHLINLILLLKQISNSSRHQNWTSGMLLKLIWSMNDHHSLECVYCNRKKKHETTATTTTTSKNRTEMKQTEGETERERRRGEGGRKHWATMKMLYTKNMHGTEYNGKEPNATWFAKWRERERKNRRKKRGKTHFKHRPRVFMSIWDGRWVCENHMWDILEMYARNLFFMADFFLLLHSCRLFCAMNEGTISKKKLLEFHVGVSHCVWL